ncbi:uncharacterized protein LOC111047376 isoform X2 [Nilaparvata lugens]|uniref:uncharacterized protein LOC111047376 isoform X2 n=1 Tax=Nilaparvata lugens TaxID=108931 RepID=UPI00193DC858|nr:uncharacterized protein LOC111047376 isoform X2 [Nilaparvata lugens]
MEILANRNTQRIVNDNTQLLVSPAKAGYIERLDEKIFIKKGLNIIGREHYCHIVIPNEALSSKHALIYVEDEDKHFVCDLKSTNGTKVNDELISDKTFHPLNDGDTVSFGGYDVIYFKLAEGIGGILDRSTDGIQTTSTQAIENDAKDPLDDSFEFPSASDVDGLFEQSVNNFTIPETPPIQSTPKNCVTNGTPESCTNTSIINAEPEESGDGNEREGEGSTCHNSDASFNLVLEDTFNFNNSDNAATNVQNELCDKVEYQALRIEEENDEIVTEAIDADNQIPIEDLCTQACDNGAPTVYAGEPQQSIGANDETMVVTHEEENSEILKHLAKEVENPVPIKNSQEAFSSSSDDEDERLLKTDVCSLPATQILQQKSSVKRCTRTRKQQEEALEDSVNADLNKNRTDSSALNSKSNESPDETLVIDGENSKINEEHSEILKQLAKEVEDPVPIKNCQEAFSSSSDDEDGSLLKTNVCSLPATQILQQKSSVKRCSRTRKQQEALEDSVNKNGTDSSALNSKFNETPDEIEAETLVIDEESSKMNKSPQVGTEIEDLSTQECEPSVSNIYAGVPQPCVGSADNTMLVDLETSNPCNQLESNFRKPPTLKEALGSPAKEDELFQNGLSSSDLCSLPATQILPKKLTVKLCTRTRKQPEEALQDSVNADLKKNGTDASVNNSKSNRYTDETAAETLVIDEVSRKIIKSPQVASQISIENLCTQECVPGVSNVYAGVPQQYAGFADETMLFDLKTSNGHNQLESINVDSSTPLKEKDGQSKISQIQPKDVHSPQIHSNSVDDDDDDDVSLLTSEATQLLPMKTQVNRCPRKPFKHVDSSKNSSNADSNCNKVDESDNFAKIGCVKVVPASKIIVHDDSSTDDDLFPEDMVLDKSLNQRQPKISVEKVKTMNQLQNCVSKTPSATKKTNCLEDLKNDLMTQPIISFESISQIHNYLSKSQSSSEENKSVDLKNDVLTESPFKKPSSHQVKKSSIFENISKCDPDEMISPAKSETISQIQNFISKSSSRKECNSLEDLKNDLLTQPIFPKPGPSSNQIKKSSIENATNFSPDEISTVKSESLTQIKDFVSKNESRTRKKNQTTVSAVLENVESGADEIPASPGRSESTSQIQQFVSKSRTRSLSSRESVCEAEATQTKAKRTRVPSRKMKEANEDATAKEKKKRGRPRKVVIEDDDSSPEIVITSKKTSTNSKRKAEDGLLSPEADSSTSKYPKLEVTKSTTNQPNDEMDLDIADMIKMRKRSTSIRPGSLHLVKPSQNHNVIFTFIKKSSDLPNKVKKLGGTIGTSPADCTVLVAEEVKRTVKFLCVVGLGKPIVDPKWVHDSYQANSFLDPMKYVLKDLKKEAEFHFNLENSLQKAKEEPLLKKYSVFVTPSVKPPPSEMKEIIESCGGRFLDNLPIRWPANSLIISCIEDEIIYSKWKLKAKPFKILEAEGLIKAILQQHLNFDIHLL